MKSYLNNQKYYIRYQGKDNIKNKKNIKKYLKNINIRIVLGIHGILCLRTPLSIMSFFFYSYEHRN